MKKYYLLSTVLLILLFIFCGCNQKATESNTLEKQSNVYESSNQSQTPIDKMNITKEDIDLLYSLWPPNDSSFKDYGEIISFNIKSKVGTKYTDIDYTFKSNETIADLKNKFGMIIKGDWQDSDFTDNSSIYDGFVNDNIYTNCLIEDYKDHNRVTIELDMEKAYPELDAIMEKHWPTDLLDLHDALNDDNLYFKSFVYSTDDNIISYDIGWRISGHEKEVLDYFKEKLANKQSYEYLQEYMYAGPLIACEIDDITINIKFNKEMNIIDIVYSRAITQ